MYNEEVLLRISNENYGSWLDISFFKKAILKLFFKIIKFNKDYGSGDKILLN